MYPPSKWPLYLKVGLAIVWAAIVFALIALLVLALRHTLA